MAISRFTTIGCTAAGLAAIYVSSQLLPFYRAHHELKASRGHVNSFSISIVAPKQHHGIQENYSFSIPVKRFKGAVSDEEILARFTRGFFSGFAFTPERWLLSLAPIQLTDIPVIKKAIAIRSQNSDAELAIGPEIWDLSSISPKSTPPIASLLFGNFLVLDSSSMTPTQRDRLPSDYARHAKPPHAFVEFTYGGEDLGLVGSHRFEFFQRSYKSQDEGHNSVIFLFESYRKQQRLIPKVSGLLQRSTDVRIRLETLASGMVPREEYADTGREATHILNDLATMITEITGIQAAPAREPAVDDDEEADWPIIS
ncbi:hypothetical protein NPX13_g2726 [Xylaria arbuscula]|uniref:Uncharacterized protein n=1 Tax=Xylaria arbuscula TaxID=114810 RepID=A0A9W8NK62_9PEZI|nr:hypothetical protein NPX13_g2726 [Xylaria arbuscula]